MKKKAAKVVRKAVPGNRLIKKPIVKFPADPRGIVLSFAVASRDVAPMCEWLDNHFYTYTFRTKNIYTVIFKVDMGAVLGVAGRGFDVGYALGALEKGKVYSL